tara:strand:+ start:646 stop:1050 length:405 start_codon:yes stop_codon:yes gene_type:complete
MPVVPGAVVSPSPWAVLSGRVDPLQMDFVVDAQYLSVIHQGEEYLAERAMHPRVALDFLGRPSVESADVQLGKLTAVPKTHEYAPVCIVESPCQSARARLASVIHVGLNERGGVRMLVAVLVHISRLLVAVIRR